MAAILRLECIGDDTDQQFRLYRNMTNEMLPGLGDLAFSLPKRWWAAEITGPSPKYGYERQFLRYKKDYSEANSVGSRGVYAYYILQKGRIYEVSAPRSWKNTDRYFCRVQAGEIVRIDREDVDRWLNDRLASTSTTPQGSG